ALGLDLQDDVVNALRRHLLALLAGVEGVEGLVLLPLLLHLPELVPGLGVGEPIAFGRALPQVDDLNGRLLAAVVVDAPGDLLTRSDDDLGRRRDLGASALLL